MTDAFKTTTITEDIRRKRVKMTDERVKTTATSPKTQTMTVKLHSSIRKNPTKISHQMGITAKPQTTARAGRRERL